MRGHCQDQPMPSSGALAPTGAPMSGLPAQGRLVRRCWRPHPMVKIFMRCDCSRSRPPRRSRQRMPRRRTGSSRAGAGKSRTLLLPCRGGEEQNVALALVVAFFVIMLLELDERSPQRTFPEQDPMGQSLLFNRSHPALCKRVPIRAVRGKSQTLHAPCCQGLPVSRCTGNVDFGIVRRFTALES